MFFGLLVLGLALAGVWMANAPTKPTALQLVQRAEQSRDAGNLSAAVQDYRDAVLATPNDDSIRVALAAAYSALGEHQNAAKELSRAWSLGSADPTVGPALVSAHLAAGDVDAALEWLDKDGVVADPLQLLAFRARAYQGKGQADKARRLYAQILNEDENHEQARLGLAQLEAPRRAPQQLPETSTAVTLGFDGQQALARGNYLSAQASFEKALEIDESHLSSRLGLVQAVLQNGDLARARTLFAQIPPSATRSADGDFLRALIAKKSNDPLAATVAAKNVLAREPGHLDASLLLATIQFESGSYEQATLTLKRLHKEYPERVRPMRLLARNQIALGQLRSAVTTVQQAAVLSPADPKVLGLFGEIFGDAATAPLSIDGKECRVIRDLERISSGGDSTARSQGEFNTATRDRLIYFARLRVGDYDSARKLARSLSNQSPTEPDYHYLHGLALEYLRSPKSAREHYQRAIDLDPKHNDARLRLAQVVAEQDHPLSAKDYLETLLDSPGLTSNAKMRIGFILARLQLRSGEAQGARERLRTMARTKKSILTFVATELSHEASASDALLVSLRASHDELASLIDRAQTLQLLQMWPELVPIIEALRARAPQAVGSLRLLGAAQTRAGAYDDARISLRAYTQLQPAEPGGYVGMALTYLLTGRPTDATLWLEKALSADNSHPPTRRLLAAMALDNGATQEAKTHLAAIMEPERQIVHAQLLDAETLMASGDANGAIERYQSAYAQRPNYELALRLYAALEAAGTPTLRLTLPSDAETDNCLLEARAAFLLQAHQAKEAIGLLRHPFQNLTLPPV